MSLNRQCAVIVATVRALKMHGGGPDVVAGKPLDHVYKEENLQLVQAGCANLIHHIHNIKKFGVKAVVAINRSVTGNVSTGSVSFPVNITSYLFTFMIITYLLLLL